MSLICCGRAEQEKACPDSDRPEWAGERERPERLKPRRG